MNSKSGGFVTKNHNKKSPNGKKDVLQRHYFLIRILLVLAIVSFLLFSNIGIFSWVYEEEYINPDRYYSSALEIDISSNHSVKIIEKTNAQRPTEQVFLAVSRSFPFGLKSSKGFDKLKFPLQPTIHSAFLSRMLGGKEVKKSEMLVRIDKRSRAPRASSVLVIPEGESGNQPISFISELTISGLIGYQENSAPPKAHLILPLFSGAVADIRDLQVKLELYEGVFPTLVKSELFLKSDSGWKRLKLHKVKQSDFLIHSKNANRGVLMTAYNSPVGDAVLEFAGIRRNIDEELYLHLSWPGSAPQ